MCFRHAASWARNWPENAMWARRMLQGKLIALLLAFLMVAAAVAVEHL